MTLFSLYSERLAVGVPHSRRIAGCVLCLGRRGAAELEKDRRADPIPASLTDRSHLLLGSRCAPARRRGFLMCMS